MKEAQDIFRNSLLTNFSSFSKSSHSSAVLTKAGKTRCGTTSHSMSASSSCPKRLAGEFFVFEVFVFVTTVSIHPGSGQGRATTGQLTQHRSTCLRRALSGADDTWLLIFDKFSIFHVYPPGGGQEGSDVRLWSLTLALCIHRAGIIFHFMTTRMWWMKWIEWGWRIG